MTLDPRSQKQYNDNLKNANKNLAAAKAEHLDQVAPEKRSSFLLAITTKDPRTLSTFEERGASIAAKLDVIKNNPKFQQLPQEHKTKVLARMYDEYVEPSYKGFSTTVPNKDAWIRMASAAQFDPNAKHNVGDGFDGRERSISAASFYDSTGKKVYNQIDSGMAQAFSGISLFGLKVSNKIFHELHGINNTFNAHLPQFLQYPEKNIEAIEKDHQRLINTEKQRIESDKAWLNTHYRDSVLGSLANLSGEIVATLPIYEATGAGLGKVGQIGKIGTLTNKLSATPLGKWAYGTLIAAADGYLGTLATTGDKHEAETGAKLGAGFGILGGAYKVGQVLDKESPGKIPSYSMIKKWTASVLAMGGKPFAEDLAASAMHEDIAIVEHAETHGKSSDPNVMHLGNDIYIKHTSEGKGSISYLGVDHPYNTKEEQQTIYSRIEKMAQKKRELEDPLTAKLHEAEKITQGSIAQQLYGKPLRALSKNQRQRVLQTRLKLIGEAAEEAPAHLPEFQKAETEHEIEKQVQANPELGSWFDKIQKEYGEPIVDVNAKNTIEAVKTETGIKDPVATIKKLNKSQQLLKQAKEAGAEYEPINGASAFLNFRNDSISFFKKPTRSERIAADGTKIGARDKRAWNEILKSDNRKAFVEVLKEADGGRIHFENDLHRMLYHYSNREGLNQPLREKLLREIKKLKPKDVKSWTTQDIGVASDNTVIHLYELAKGGQLGAGEYVFNSTNINPDWSPTKWQMQLHNENDNAELQKVKEALKRHPEQLKTALTSMKLIIKNKYKADNIQTYLELDAQLRKIALQMQSATIGLGEGEYK